ncbi:splicing factor 30 [Aphomia sociella]
MAEDLRNYKLQLQQVEAALLTDAQNEELLKLKADLEEVIELTQDLTQDGDSKVPNIHGSSNDDDVTASLLAAEEGETAEKSYSNWNIGEKCLAKWRADGMYYEALIEEVGGDNLKVKFDGYTTLEVVSLDDVKPMGSSLKRPLGADESKHGKGYNREYLKKKKQKKQQRFKQIEEERESEKNKWLSFHSKATKKPGVKSKSIFASPDNLTGRVGIGTCGISGRPMTEYTPGEKWKKGG